MSKSLGRGPERIFCYGLRKERRQIKDEELVAEAVLELFKENLSKNRVNQVLHTINILDSRRYRCRAYNPWNFPENKRIRNIKKIENPRHGE